MYSKINLQVNRIFADKINKNIQESTQDNFQIGTSGYENYLINNLKLQNENNVMLKKHLDDLEGKIGKAQNIADTFLK